MTNDIAIYDFDELTDVKMLVMQHNAYSYIYKHKLFWYNSYIGHNIKTPIREGNLNGHRK